MQRLVGTSLLVLVAFAGRASADDKPDWRLEGGFGVRFGSFFVDGVDAGSVVPVHLEGGLRRDRLFLFAEYQFASITLPTAMTDPATRGTTTTGPASGLVHRLGAHARYNFGSTDETDAAGSVWLEGGLGVEHMQGDEGGEWTRPDLALGFGGMIVGRDEHKHGGLSMGLRLTLARRNDIAPNATAVCSGPCDTPTTPTGWDRSILWDMTLLFGR